MANERLPGGLVSPEGKAFLSISEVARRWGVSKRTVQRFVADGLLEMVHFGRAVRIAVNEVLRFEATHRSMNFI